MPDLHTPFCDMLDIRYPIILAGMSTGQDDVMPSPPRLAAAVSNAGGLGVMGCGSRKPETIDWCIREFRKLSSAPFGVDLLLPASFAEVNAATTGQVHEQLVREYPRHVAFVQELLREHSLPEVAVEDTPPMSPQQLRRQFEVVLDHRVPVFVAGLGDPAWVVPAAREQGMRVGGMVGAVRHAVRQKAAGVDFVGAQGTEAGGHTGTIASFVLIPQVVDAIAPIPVMAAGGIGSGRHVAAALALGAQAAWCGTAFLVAEENDIPAAHQQQILGGRSEQFVLSTSSTGKPQRGYSNAVKDAWSESGLQTLAMPLQGILMEPFNQAARTAGRWDLIWNPSGQVGGMLTERRPARDILLDMVHEAEETIEALQAAVG